MWMYKNKIVSALLLIFFISLGLHYAKMHGFPNFFNLSFLKIELFSKLHNPVLKVTG